MPRLASVVYPGISYLCSFADAIVNSNSRSYFG